jgi:carbonic anhydrase
MNGTEQLVQNNVVYAQTHKPMRQPQPATGVAIVHCMDHRNNIYEILGVTTGDVDHIANAGGVVTDDVLRSLVISQRRKGTTEVMVIGHTPCGMQGLDETALVEEMRQAGGRRPAFAIHGFADPNQRVAQSVQTVRNCTFLPHREAVTGWIYDMETGKLREVFVENSTSGSRRRPRTTLLGAHVLNSGRKNSGY